MNDESLAPVGLRQRKIRGTKSDNREHLIGVRKRKSIGRQELGEGRKSKQRRVS